MNQPFVGNTLGPEGLDSRVSIRYMAVSTNQGPHFGSPYHKDHNVFGSILGPPIYGSPHWLFLSIEALGCGCPYKSPACPFGLGPNELHAFVTWLAGCRSASASLSAPVLKCSLNPGSV